VLESWRGDADALRPGRAVLVGFPEDEGIRLNRGRPGAAAAPNEIRTYLYRLTPWDGRNDVSLTDDPPLDLGNVLRRQCLEASQEALAQVIGAILSAGAVPVVLGGGHETAFGHFLGYVLAGRPLGIINIDAHLDVRPCLEGRGHSGSPFRQAMEYPTQPLPGSHYVCLGAQPQAVGRAHVDYLREKGATILWRDQVDGRMESCLVRELDRLGVAGCAVYITLDADAVDASEVPGVSAPNSCGLRGAEVLACVRRAGQSPQVASFDLVEINPSLDPDGRSARWAALAVWNFLVGLACRKKDADHGKHG
jgi:formiminoglutamase